MAKGSRKISKSKGDKGNPCLVPHEGGNSQILMRTEARQKGLWQAANLLGFKVHVH